VACVAEEGEDLVRQQAGHVDSVGARQVRELGHADHGGVGAWTASVRVQCAAVAS
jgi:hypothetical protein